MKVADRRRLRRARLAALGISPPLGSRRSTAPAVDVVRHVGALQAQDYLSGMWSVGLRSGLTLAEIEQAVRDREIVRTWPMRGTLHLVPAEDARWMCETFAGRQLAAMGPRYRQLGITEADVATARRVFDDHLDEPLSRPAVVALLAEHGIDPSGQRAYHLVGHHCMTGMLCQGPVAGKQPTFVKIDAWVPCSRRLSREEALATLVERYVRGHGPVTEKDVAGWLAQPLGLVREALGLIGDRVAREQLDGTVWLTHVEPRSPNGAGAVHLLPQWDEFLLGYKTRDVTLPDEHVERVVPGRNLQFQPTLVVDGEVAGTWRRRAGRHGTVVEVGAFRPLSTARRAALDRAATAYGRFLGVSVEVVEVAAGRS